MHAQEARLARAFFAIIGSLAKKNKKVQKMIGLQQLRKLRHWYLRRNLDLYRDRFHVLEAAAELQRQEVSIAETSMITILSGQVPIDVTALLTKLKGENILVSDQHDYNLALLDFQLKALVASGELGKFAVENRYYLKPQALNSLAQYQLEMKKLRVSVVPVWVLAVLTFAYVVVAALQLWLC